MKNKLADVGYRSRTVAYGEVTFFIQTFFIRNKVYTQQYVYKHYLYETKFIRNKLYTVAKLIHNETYTTTKFIQKFFIRKQNLYSNKIDTCGFFIPLSLVRIKSSKSCTSPPANTYSPNLSLIMCPLGYNDFNNLVMQTL